jgi:hypothetical protein
MLGYWRGHLGWFLDDFDEGDGGIDKNYRIWRKYKEIY